MLLSLYYQRAKCSKHFEYPTLVSIDQSWSFYEVFRPNSDTLPQLRLCRFMHFVYAVCHVSETINRISKAEKIPTEDSFSSFVKPIFILRWFIFVHGELLAGCQKSGPITPIISSKVLYTPIYIWLLGSPRLCSRASCLMRHPAFPRIRY